MHVLKKAVQNVREVWLKLRSVGVARVLNLGVGNRQSHRPPISGFLTHAIAGTSAIEINVHQRLQPGGGVPTKFLFREIRWMLPAPGTKAEFQTRRSVLLF